MERWITTPLRDAKNELLAQFARIGKALASPARLELLDLLAQGEKPVELLAEQGRLSVTNTSNHLKELRNAALVVSRKDGLHVYYRLATPAVHGLVRSLQDIATQQLADAREIVGEHFRTPDTLDADVAQSMIERAQSGEVVLLDVRPEDEYLSDHLPGAVSIPASELQRRLSELPRNREIVAYCRGAYCAMAVEAVEILQSHGFQARRIELGVPEWRASGLAVAGASERNEIVNAENRP